ncbi:hypothetical protein ACRN9O_12585 [Shewanella oncorhynchi]|uniref:hypothetical protein n=1 Tax=Shewanella TaxID=22 RepID=UPI0021D87A67|nr:hypothetical protein [Shewanella sp. SM29]MCU8075272.1 hypothetical protein [Shewanella sp. SM29]
MKIKFELKKDFSKNHEIIVDKFFQFVIIGDKTAGKTRSVDIFTAISYRAKSGDTVPLKIEATYENYSKNNQKISIENINKHDYYQKDDILNQFWGANTKTLENRDFSEKFPVNSPEYAGEIDSFFSALTNNILFVEESNKGIEKFFIIPNKINISEQKIKLTPSNIKIPPSIKNFASHGFWIHTRFTGEFKEGDGTFSFQHEIDSDENLSFHDFKIYYQVPKDHDIKYFNYKLNEKDVETIKVYSQQNTSYFDDWKKLKIYNSSLLRLLHGNSVNDELKNSRKKKLIGEIELIDNKANRKKELYTIIISMFFSLLVSLGLDATRLADKNFSSLFIIKTLELDISSSIVWFMLCIGLIIKYIFISNNDLSLLRKIIYTLVSIPILFSMFAAIHIPDTLASFSDVDSCIQPFIIFDVAVVVFFTIGLIFQKTVAFLNARFMHSSNNFLVKLTTRAKQFVNVIWG